MRLTRRTFMAASALSLTNAAFGQTRNKRIVFIAGPDSHGYGEHEHIAGCKLLADRLNALPNVTAEVVENKWPADDAILFSADAVVMYSDGIEKNVTDGHKDAFRKLIDSKVGLGIMHYALFPPKSQYKEFMQATGGFFQPNWSVNPIWKPTFEKIPVHPITNGVKPFSVRDEWYYHMRFSREKKNLTMLLSDLPPANTLIRSDGPYSNNTHVRKAVFGDKKPQHLAWAFKRDSGGRGFGFTGGHYHWNWAQNDYRTLVLNAIAWLAGIEIPSKGIPSKTPTYEELIGNLGPMPEKTNITAIKKLLEGFKD